MGCQIKGLDKPCFVLGRCASPMTWMKSDRQQVSLVFLFAIPETDARASMHLISGMARLSEAPRLVEQLLKAGDTFELLNVLKQVKLRGSPPTLA